MSAEPIPDQGFRVAEAPTDQKAEPKMACEMTDSELRAAILKLLTEEHGKRPSDIFVAIVNEAKSRVWMRSQANELLSEL